MAHSPGPEPQPTDLRDYLRILRTRKWEIIVVTALVVGATMIFSIRQTPLYAGEAKVLVSPPQNPTAVGPPLQQVNLDTQRELVLSETVADRVRTELGLTETVDELQRNLEVQVVTDTEVLVIRYLDPDPERAAQMANAFADAYVAFRSDQILNQYEAAAEQVQTRIDEIRADLGDVNQRIASTSELDQSRLQSLQADRDTLLTQLGFLQQQLLTIQSTAAVNQTSVAQVIQPAEVPESPASPDIVRNGVLALFAGLVLGIGLAFLRERLDDRVRSREEMEERLGAPILAAVPRVSSWPKGEDYLVTKAEPKSPVSEAYRTLATNIVYLASRQELQVLLVTSSMGGEGKTTTSANLGVAMARVGRRVVLVSADLRRPRLHRFFGLRNVVGLSSALSAEGKLDGAIREPGLPNLRLITSGPTPGHPAELLAGQAMVDLVQKLRKVSDVVIIDAPPVLAVADASVLAPLADAVLVVIDPEHASRSLMTQARIQLDNAGANVIGGVFNNFDPKDGTTYPYYHYRYYGRYDVTPNGSKGRHRPEPERESTFGFETIPPAEG